ncbi:hypothetical protein H6P81_007633 [Aristolochia fimbriata]|uniref:Trichome birefringence-like N-terminal domain-containing protein n=1 Tax=Aristolochia fimbriata TaxID=158543 RepID=A0AAV7F1Y7_ARIFI|nr:hypothetical protein H6P81_007633 [Aristolochia fimbriata]
MKGGSLIGLRSKHFLFTIFALVCTTIFLWSWERNPIPDNQFQILTSEDSDESGERGSTTTERNQVFSKPNEEEDSPDTGGVTQTKVDQLSLDDRNGEVLLKVPENERNPVSSKPNEEEDSPDVVGVTQAKVDQLSLDDRSGKVLLKAPENERNQGFSKPNEEDATDAGRETEKKLDPPSPDDSSREVLLKTPNVGDTQVIHSRDDPSIAPVGSTTITAPEDQQQEGCNFAQGRWVHDDRRPLYSGFGCRQWLSDMWACRLSQRTDFAYEKFRWQPFKCTMPEFEGSSFLRRMRNKTIALVGDSLGRQQFQSLMCMVTGGKEDLEVQDVGKEYGLVKARGAIRPDGWVYRFPRTNTTILYYWSASLCELEPLNISNPKTDYAMHLDRPATFIRKYLDRFDVLLLNTGHHWNRGKLVGNRWIMYVNGKPNEDRYIAQIGNAKNLTIHSVVRWLDSQLPQHPKLKVFLRTIAPRHFVNGDWNTGGSCDNTVPLAGGSEVVQEKSADPIAEAAVKGTRVKLLDITAISQLRDECHISKYSAKAADGVHDCLHWCLPGVPDTWNELLAAQI